MMRKNNEAVIFSRYISNFLYNYAPKMLTNSECTLKSYKDALTLYVLFLESEGITPSGFTKTCFERLHIEKWICWLKENRRCCHRHAIGTGSVYKYRKERSCIHNPSVCNCGETGRDPVGKDQTDSHGGEEAIYYYCRQRSEDQNPLSSPESCLTYQKIYIRGSWEPSRSRCAPLLFQSRRKTCKIDGTCDRPKAEEVRKKSARKNAQTCR